LIPMGALGMVRQNLPYREVSMLPWILVTLLFPVLSFANVPPNYLKEVQPILNKRCVACHGCYEAPCQLNLQSYDGFRRGFSAVPIYSGKRIPKVAPSRMVDAKSVREWRSKEFSAVLAHDDEPSAADHAKEYQKSLTYQLLEQGQLNDPAQGFSLEHAAQLQALHEKDKRQCLATGNQLWEHDARKSPYKLLSFEDYSKAYANGGMPFGLPRLSAAEQDILTRWMEAGAPGPTEEEKTQLELPKNAEAHAKWEAFFNGDSAQAQQAARYIYEHVFSAVITIEHLEGEYYELVRSSTLLSPIAEIVTELPYDAPPKGTRVYYRLRKVTRTPVAKTQNIWHLNDAKLAHLTSEFLESNWGKQPIPLPTYGSNNMFDYFRSIPAAIRSRFMMENSRLIVGAMVQGTVCIGSRATYAIADHFWAWFLKPEVDPSVTHPSLGFESLAELGTAPQPLDGRLVRILQKVDFANERLLMLAIREARKVSNLVHFRDESDDRDKKIAEILVYLKSQDLPLEEIAGALHHFLKTVRANHAYQAAFEKQLRLNLQKMVATKYRTNPGLSLLDLWTGVDPKTNEVNPNAWLSITRHEKSATVQFGPEGGKPQSIWIMSYSNFERLYYNLVASFQVWGSLPHKLATWRHMSYVRLEGEDLAISLLPVDQREEVRRWFTHGLGGIANDRFFPLQSTLSPARTDSDKWINAGNASDTVAGFIQELRIRYNDVVKAGKTGDDLVTAEQAAFEKHLLALQNRSEFSFERPDVVDKTQVYPQYLPNISYVRVEGPNGQFWVYTLLANRGYKSHTIVILENPEREPARDTLSVYRGFVGAYPNLFLDVPAGLRDRFAADIAAIRTDRDWRRFRAQYAVKRNEQRVWEMFDWFQAWKTQRHPGVDPVEQGVSDLSQYQF